jgi:phosphoribosylglycinamide formyltransferase-1
MPSPFKISVLISGGGTTLRNLIEKQSVGQLAAEISQVISNNPQAGGIQFAEQAGLTCQVLDHRKFDTPEVFSDSVFASIRTSGASLVVLGGFLRRLKIPGDFENRVINIHPSLIPAFCGQGLYGTRVHRAVIDYGCKISGCTVHFVDDQYDHGPIIAQRTVPVLATDDAQTLSARVFEQECELYPETINLIAAERVRLCGRLVEIV